ncbi:cytosine-purine permease [Ilyonectria sp. MPI-CAGE-AT-0026]|nr:cytosine-purine permease [Ilyonectria sp. MPI-CAGE-AT-0026]
MAKHEKESPEVPDLEKSEFPRNHSSASVDEGDATHLPKSPLAWVRGKLTGSVEARGIDPVPVEERSDKNGLSLFAVWFTANCSLLPITTGISGPLVFGIGLPISSLIIVLTSLVFMIPVAWIGTIGPKTGMRQIVQTRYYFGFDLVLIVAILQLATLTGYTIITSIVSGQTLTALSEGSLSLAVGIVLTVIVALFVSFMGYNFLHYFEQYSWIPSMVALIVTVGVGGKSLRAQTQPTSPSVQAIMSFISLCASLCISWAAIVSDYSVYISPDVSRYRTFTFVYAGYCIPSILLMVLGAAIGGAVPNNPSWVEANNAYSVGGVMYAMVSSSGNFGKFIAVLLAFSVMGNTACSLYSISLSMQSLHSILVRVPRYIFTLVISAIVIPVAIVAAANFYASLTNFLGVIGYWTSIYVGISLTEHYYFRKGDYGSYEMLDWNMRQKLPVGIAALATSALSVGLIIPSMSTAWYVGPIAIRTGDIGVEVGMVLGCLLYIPLRTLERRIIGR